MNWYVSVELDQGVGVPVCIRVASVILSLVLLLDVRLSVVIHLL